MHPLTIQSRIYELRDQKIMLDFDLAELYGTETKILKQAVRRNMDRFPSDFMFELSKQEYDSLRSQIVTLETGRGKHSKYLPFAFTEQGVAMLASVLNNPQAIQVNIAIVRTFVLMRQYALNHQELTERLHELENRYDQKFIDIYEALNYLIKNDETQTQQNNRKRIGYK